MKIKKIVALLSVASVMATTFTAISVPTVSAATVGTTFTEDFEGYTADANLSTTLSALMDDGWYMVGEDKIYTDTSAAPYKDLTSFVQVVNYAGRQCLMIGTPNQNKNNSAIGLGRKFPGQGDAAFASGIWEINFKFYPYATEYAKVQFLFSMNTLDGSAANTRIAQHNILAAYNNKMHMGHRDYMTLYNGNNPIPQGTLAGSLVWYDVKVNVNCDARYYSVELYKGSELVARRSPISFNGNETVGFFKLSALGLTSGHRVYVDDISIKPASRETLIYEEDFEAFSSTPLASAGMSLGGEKEDIAGTSYFAGGTPWRALTASGKDYGLVADSDLSSQVVRLGDDSATSGVTESSGLVYIPVYDKLVDPKMQETRGKVRLSFKIKPSVIADSGFQVNAVPDFNADLAKAFELADNEGNPAIVTDSGKVDLNAAKWYDANVILDVVNKMATVTLNDHSTSEEVANFSRDLNALTAVKGVIFNAVGGTSVYMDDIKIEYYEYDSSINLNDMTNLMEIGSVKVGDTPLGSLSDITNGSTINVKIAYSNQSDAVLNSLLFVAYYGDDMLLATSSVKPDAVGLNEKGIKSFYFTVPSAATLNMSKVDKISLCLWKGFKNSVPYGDKVEFEDAFSSGSYGAVSDTSKPKITYSYNDSVLNISGKANTDSKYLTVQILKQGNTFETGDGLANADNMVFYRAQVPVTEGEYSLDVRFDTYQNLSSTLVTGNYPTAIYIDDVKQDIDDVYLTSYPDFVAAYTALNSAAAADDLAEFENVLNTKRSELNFDSKLLGTDALGDEIEPYFDYIKANPLNAAKEAENSERFNSYVAAAYLNGRKTDNVGDSISNLLIDDDVKELCGEILETDAKGKYFTSIISGKSIGDPAQLEQSIKESLILTAAKYGNGYGELKKVLEKFGSEIGIASPISSESCRALMGKTFSDATSFKTAYDNAALPQVTQTDSSDKKTTIAPIQIPISGSNSTTPTVITPVTKTFNDIDNYEWAMTEILALADKNIISGVAENRFEPARNITREEFAKILVAAIGASDYSYNGNVFSDASDSDWFVKYINIAAELGIVRGIGNGVFGTGHNITRQDMAVMIYNALKYRNMNMATDEFKFDDDGQIADYAKNAVAALHGMGAINGVTETTFEPTGLATRAQAAKVVYKVLKELQG